MFLFFLLLLLPFATGFLFLFASFSCHLLLLACNLLAVACYLANFSSFVCFPLFLLVFFHILLAIWLALAAGFLLSFAFPFASCLFLLLLALHAFKYFVFFPFTETLRLTLLLCRAPLVPWGRQISCICGWGGHTSLGTSAHSQLISFLGIPAFNVCFIPANPVNVSIELQITYIYIMERERERDQYYIVSVPCMFK